MSRIYSFNKHRTAHTDCQMVIINGIDLLGAHSACVSVYICTVHKYVMKCINTRKNCGGCVYLHNVCNLISAGWRPLNERCTNRRLHAIRWANGIASHRYDRLIHVQMHWILLFCHTKSDSIAIFFLFSSCFILILIFNWLIYTTIVSDCSIPSYRPTT